MELFDRVTHIKFHATTDLGDVELRPFTKLTKVAKPIDFSKIKDDLSVVSGDKSMSNFMAMVEKNAPTHAKQELSKVLSECQIGKITHDTAIWFAEIDVNQFSCRTN